MNQTLVQKSVLLNAFLFFFSNIFLQTSFYIFYLVFHYVCTVEEYLFPIYSPINFLLNLLRIKVLLKYVKKIKKEDKALDWTSQPISTTYFLYISHQIWKIFVHAPNFAYLIVTGKFCVTQFFLRSRRYKAEGLNTCVIVCMCTYTLPI